MKEIILTRGYVALIDDCDFELVSKYKWQANVHNHVVYAGTDVNRTRILMHRLILQAPKGILVDHIDHNGLNNTRDNLRLATRSQNGYNARLSKGNTSGVKGVYWCNYYHKWCALIHTKEKRYHVGYFATLEEAAEATRIKRLELHGKFACEE
jgi:hypothetical protein